MILLLTRKKSLLIQSLFACYSKIIKKDEFRQQKNIEIKKPGIQLTTDNFSRVNGFIETIEQGDKISQIRIKPGKLIKIKKLTQKKLKEILNLRHKIYFAGEKIFNDIKLKYNTIIDVVQLENAVGLLLRPVQEFNVSKLTFQVDTSLARTQVELQSFRVNYPHMTVLLTNPGQKRVNLIDNAIWIKPPDNLNKINLKIRIKVVPKTKLNNVSNIGFLSQNSLNLSQLLIKKIFSDPIQLNTLVQDNQYVIRHTILAKVMTTFKQKLSNFLVR